MTLLELMTVVTLIAVVAAAAAPSIGDALAERKMTQTSLDVVRIARRGRSEAAGYGRAHMLRYLSGDTGTGVFELYRGINNHCNTNDWNAVTGGGVCNREGGFCRDFIVVSQETDTDTIAVVPDNIVGEPLDICFEPSGRPPVCPPVCPPSFCVVAALVSVRFPARFAPLGSLGAMQRALAALMLAMGLTLTPGAFAGHKEYQSYG